MTTRLLGAIAAIGLLAACSNTDQNANAGEFSITE